MIFGLEVAEAVFRRSTPRTWSQLGPVGEVARGRPVLRVEGSAAALLTAERTALNFLGRLSGVATQTARVVRAVAARAAARRSSTRARPRPGCGVLEKPAVADGGGVNHRPGSRRDPDQGEPSPRRAAWGRRCGAPASARPDLPLEVEVRDAEEIDEALEAARRGCCSTT